MNTKLGVTCVAIALFAALAGCEAFSSPASGALGRQAEGQVLRRTGRAPGDTGAVPPPVPPPVEKEQTCCDPPAARETTETAEEASETTTQAQALKPLQPSAVSVCPCERCSCPDPLICKNGHCCSTYAITFAASWCGPCKRLYPVVRDLRSRGYPVYFFDVDKFPEAAAQCRISSVPHTVVYRDGEVFRRIPGVASAISIAKEFHRE